MYMSELVHEDLLDELEGEPAAGRGALEDKLDAFAVVEIAAPKLSVGWELFERHDIDQVGAGDGYGDGSHAGEEVVGCVMI